MASYPHPHPHPTPAGSVQRVYVAEGYDRSHDCEIYRIPARSDNYIWLIRLPDGNGIVVDPADADPVRKGMEVANVSTLSLILNTHHHHDHVGANLELKVRA